MQQQQPLAVLKKRQQLWLKTFPKIEVITNQYQTKLNSNLKFFRVFEIHSLPEVETDSHQIYRQAMKQMPQSIRKTLDCTYFAKRGYTIWYLTKEELSEKDVERMKANPQCYNITVLDQQYNISLQLVKQSQITDKQSLPLVTQFLNIKFKQMILRDCKMKELSPNIFFPQWSSYFYDEKFQIEARIGFKVGLEFLEIQLYCDVNNRIKQMNKRSFLEILWEKKYPWQHYKGMRIRKMYGNYQTFEIEDIVKEITPKTVFEKNGEKLSFAEYFKRSYTLKVTEMDQPLLQVSSKQDRRFQRGGSRAKEFETKIYLIPQFVSMVQISEAAKNAARQELQLSPNECISTAAKFIKQVNTSKTEFSIIAQNRVGYAHLLPQPHIQVNQFTTLRPMDGSFKIESQIYQILKLQDVLIVYSVGNDKKFDRRQIDQSIKTLNMGGERYKIRIPEQPGCLQIDQMAGPQKWIEQVQKDMKENSKPNFILFALLDKQQQFYSYLKQQLTYRLQIDTQMFLRSKISNKQKGSLKIAGNIMKQIAAKKNKTLWKIKEQQKLALIIGISIQRLGEKFQLVISRSINKDVSVFKTKTFLLDSKEIPVQILEKQFYASLEDYIKQEKRKYKPSTIIVYRMGLNNQKYAKEHLQTESRILKQRIQFICQNKIKKEIYQPELVYIQVFDRPSQKIWIQEQSYQHGTFLPRVVNPQVGTVMRGTQDNEFYLVSYKARFGTVQPTLFKVFMNQKNLLMEFITQFTFAQAYMYYNWEGSVRLPQVLQLCRKAHRYVKPKGEYKNHTFQTTGFI